jgi:hypothetical protein
MRRRVVVSAVVVLTLLSAGVASSAFEQGMQPFGGSEDLKFAGDLWKALDGYKDWPTQSGVVQGRSPHGAWVRLYSNFATVNGHSYPIIIKENFGGEGVTKAGVESSPESWLGAVTVMVKREAGYDSDNLDWYWAKFLPDGSLDKNPMGMQLAGRVAKGMNAGCLSCHQAAGGGDYIFINDHK